MAGMLRKKKKPKNHYQNFKRDTETLRILINNLIGEKNA